MSSHLPECSLGGNSLYEWMDDCICDNLRACEQRVRVEKMADTEGHIRSVGRLEGHRAGYARALDDAALAVERGCAHTKYENCYPCWHDQYAAKIRALRVQHG